MHGSIQLTEGAAAVKEFLDYWSDPDVPKNEEPPYPAHFLENWFIEDDQGFQSEIGPPTVFIHEGNQEIFWRTF